MYKRIQYISKTQIYLDHMANYRKSQKIVKNVTQYTKIIGILLN